MRFATGCWEWAFLSAQQRTLCLCSWKGRAAGITAVLEARYETMDGGGAMRSCDWFRMHVHYPYILHMAQCGWRLRLPASSFFGLSCMDLKKHKNNLSYIITIQTPPTPCLKSQQPFLQKNWKPNPNQPCQPPSPYKSKMTIESEAAENLCQNDDESSSEDEFWLFGYG